MDDAVIAALPLRFFNADNAFALFHNRSGIDIAARALAHREAFPGHRGLVDACLSAFHFAIQRDQIARAHDDSIAGANKVQGDKHLRIPRFLPHLVDRQRHGARQIADGFFVRPVFQHFADVQQKHNRARRIEIAAQQGDGDRRCIKHGNGKPAAAKRAQARPKIPQRAQHGQRGARPRREKQLDRGAMQHGKHKAVFKFPIERAGGMLGRGNQRSGTRQGKCRQRLYKLCARAAHSVYCRNALTPR